MATRGAAPRSAGTLLLFVFLLLLPFILLCLFLFLAIFFYSITLTCVDLLGCRFLLLQGGLCGFVCGGAAVSTGRFLDFLPPFRTFTSGPRSSSLSLLSFFLFTQSFPYLFFMLFQVGLNPLLLCLFALDFLLFLLHKFGRDSPDVVLGTTEVLPQFPQEDASVLGVEEARQVDLHFLWVGEL